MTSPPVMLMARANGLDSLDATELLFNFFFFFSSVFVFFCFFFGDVEVSIRDTIRCALFPLTINIFLSSPIQDSYVSGTLFLFGV